jgi:hypothetical protein
MNELNLKNYSLKLSRFINHENIYLAEQRSSFSVPERTIDRNLLKVGAKPVPVGVIVGEKPSLKEIQIRSQSYQTFFLCKTKIFSSFCC